jgi:hypothetical protein
MWALVFVSLGNGSIPSICAVFIHLTPIPPFRQFSGIRHTHRHCQPRVPPEPERLHGCGISEKARDGCHGDLLEKVEAGGAGALSLPAAVGFAKKLEAGEMMPLRRR